MLRKKLLLLLMLFVLTGLALIAQQSAVDPVNSDTSYLLEREDLRSDTDSTFNHLPPLALFVFSFLLLAPVGVDYVRSKLPIRSYSTVFHHAHPRGPPHQPLR